MAPLLVLCAALSTQIGQAFGKQLFGQTGPLGVVALRLGFAAVILVALRRPTLPRGRDALPVLGLGVAIAGMNLIYPAMRYLPVGVASTLQLLGPLTVALLGSRRPADLGIAALAGVGVWLVNDPGAGVSWPGLVLLSAASMGGYLVLAGTVARCGGASGLALGVGVAALLGVPAGVIQSGSTLLSPELLLAGAGVAVLSAVVPYSLEQAALRRLRAGVVGVLLTTEPAIAGLAGMVVLAEHLSAPRWLGIACISVAAAAATITATR